MIAPMTACHRPHSSDFRASLALALGLALLSAAATAADPGAAATEPAPFDAPFSTPDDTAPTPTGTGTEPVFDPDFDPALPELPVASPTPSGIADAGPDYQPPQIDGYLDLAFTDGDFSQLGFSETPGGYRFTVGFRLEEVGTERWLIAPEFGYFRLGKADNEVTTVTPNDVHQGYDTTRVFSSSLDATSLDLGCRVDRILTTRLGAFVRGGLGFYHLARNDDLTLTYSSNVLPTQGGEFDGVTESLLSDSSTASGLGLFGSVGLTVKLGAVPSIYVEYSVREMDQEVLASTALGLTLNF